MSPRLRQLLGPVALGGGLGAAAGLVAGLIRPATRVELGKGLGWTALGSVLERAEVGLAVGALCALAGWILARGAPAASPDDARGPAAPGASPAGARWALWIAGLLGLLAAGWVQSAFWTPPASLAGRLLYYMVPALAVVGALAVVAAARSMASGGERWNRLALVGALTIAALLALEAAQSGHRRLARDRGSLLLVVVDCLRPDRLGTYGYSGATSPVLDRVAGASLVFERAHSTAAWTKPAMVSVLTGLYPARHGSVDPFDVLPRAEATVPELLADAGYQTVFVNGGNTFVSHEFGFDAVFEDYELIESGDARALVDAFGARLPALSRRPFFAYLHLMDVHLPYGTNAFNQNDPRLASLRDELKPGRINVGAVRALTERGELSAADRALVGRLYDAQVRFVDSELGRLLALLEQAGLAGSTTVIVTADHGEELWEHGNFEHGHTLYDEVSRVPLLIFGSGVPPERWAERRTEPTSLVDLAPTLLALAGLEPPEGAGTAFDGRNLLALRRGESGRRQGVFLSGTLYGPEKFAFLSTAGKAISTSGSSAGKFSLVGPRSFEEREWYAADDPDEIENRLSEAPQGVWSTLLRYRQTEGAQVEEIDPSAAARERLEALGYLQ